MKRDGGALKIDPIHPMSPTKLDLFVVGVCSPCFGGDWVTLNTEKVIKNYLHFHYLFSLFALGLKKKLWFSSHNNLCVQNEST